MKNSALLSALACTMTPAPVQRRSGNNDYDKGYSTVVGSSQHGKQGAIGERVQRKRKQKLAKQARRKNR